MCLGDHDARQSSLDNLVSFVAAAAVNHATNAYLLQKNAFAEFPQTIDETGRRTETNDYMSQLSIRHFYCSEFDVTDNEFVHSNERHRATYSRPFFFNKSHHGSTVTAANPPRKYETMIYTISKDASFCMPKNISYKGCHCVCGCLNRCFIITQYAV